MKLTPEHDEYLKISFAKMQSINDFIDLLNNVSKLIYGEKAFYFDTSRIKQLSNINTKSTQYKHFTIKKKNGEVRIIHAPSKELKSIQKVISIILEAICDVHPSATGFLSGKS